MIRFVKPYFDKSDLLAVAKVMASGWVAQGPKVEEMEKAVADHLKCKHVISTTNGTMALVLALRAIGIKPGDEVIVSDFTFPASAISVSSIGAVPVLVDVEMDSYNTNADYIRKAITKRTKAIMPVHQFGNMCRMDDIMNLAREHNLKVVEDAACALGAFSGPYAAGTIGDVGCFSLHASKGITCGEGGLIATNNDEYAEYIRRFSSFGDERAFRRSQTGVPFRFNPEAGNYKMSDITAAIVESQLKKIDRLIAWRVKIAREWGKIISEDYFLSKAIINKPELVRNYSHIYQSYVAICNDGQRQRVFDYMKEKEFQCGIGTHQCSRYGLGVVNPPGNKNADYLSHNSISFPRYYGLEVLKLWSAVKGKGGNERWLMP